MGEVTEGGSVGTLRWMGESGLVSTTEEGLRGEEGVSGGTL
jgi:hypothetical protein